MTTTINVPSSLDDSSFEQVISQVAPLPPDERLLLDARRTRWSSPYGLTTLLTLAQTRLTRPQFLIPEDPSTISYWSRANFFEHAHELYELNARVPRSRHTNESRVLLPVTPVTKTADVHDVVEKIQETAQSILTARLHLELRVVGRFTMSLSEVCQNVIEHAGRGGWVAVQTYKFTKRLGRWAVVIAVSDGGIGFRQSLESSHGIPHTERWNDRMALEDTVMKGVSRYRDPGRGQGLAGVNGFVRTWDGKLSVRSGTARIAVVPEWDEDEPIKEGLAFFPGAQVQLTIPERVAVT